MLTLSMNLNESRMKCSTMNKVCGNIKQLTNFYGISGSNVGDFFVSCTHIYNRLFNINRNQP